MEKDKKPLGYMDTEEKSFLNKDLNISEGSFSESVDVGFIENDFVSQLEWAMLMIQGKFKQIRFADYLKPIYANHFDKAYLLTASLNDSLRFFQPFNQFQVSPEIFPLINIKYMMIGECVTLSKIKEIPLEQKRNLKIKRKYGYEYSTSFYKKDTECFYGKINGFEVNPSFFKIDLDNKNISIDEIPIPISLHSGYSLPDNALKYLNTKEIVDVMKAISMAYQIMFSLYYEWTIYIKEYDNIGLTIPICPSILSEIYKTSILNFDSKKRMLHFVKEHYRRKIAKSNEDYSVFVQKYLRGEHKFNYRGFCTEIIPPKYDLNRIKTRKKFTNTFSD